jgi:hypothetical protein
LGKPKAFQVEEDKIIAEVTLSTIYQIFPLIWKGVEEGIRGSTRSFQSKETTLGIVGSILKDSGILPSEEGTELEMLSSWLKDLLPSKIRVGTEYFIGNVTYLGLLLSKIRVGSTKDFIDETTSSTIG